MPAAPDPYRTVVRALPDTVTRLRGDGAVLDAHVPAAFATEFPAGSLVGRRLRDVIAATLADRFDAGADVLRTTGRPWSYGYTVEVDGRTRYREVRDERTRSSRGDHNVVGHQLTAIHLGAGWSGRRAPDDPGVQDRLADLRQTIDETLGQVRRIAADPRPGALNDFGLASAVEWQSQRFGRQTGTPCVLEVAPRRRPRRRGRSTSSASGGAAGRRPLTPRRGEP